MRILSVPLLTAACLCLAGTGLVASAAPEQPSLAISPSSVKLKLGEGVQLKARLKSAEGPVLWTVVGEGAGSISSTGYYQTPSQASTPASFRIRASAGELRAETLVSVEPVSVEVKPQVAPLTTRQSHQFRAQVKGTDDQRVRWSVEGGPGNGEIGPGGLYTSPARFATPGTVVVRATSVADPGKSATATVRIGEIRLEVQPKESTVQHGGSVKFDAKVIGAPNAGVEWQVRGKDTGTINQSGVYNTPTQMVTPAEVTVIARSIADPTKTATARVRIQPIEILIAPRKEGKKGKFLREATKVVGSVVRQVTRIYLPFNPVDAIVPGPFFKGKSGKQYCPLGGGVVFDALVKNSTDDRVKWEFVGPEIGTIDEDGNYQAPESMPTPQVVQVRASAFADPTKSIVFTLHIPPVVVKTKEDVATCPMGGAVQLQAKAQNTENDQIEWSVEGGEGFGTVTETGLYRPPSTLSTPAVVRVKAASTADPSKSAIIQVQVPELQLGISPDDTQLRPGQSVRLTARVKGAEGHADVVWKVTPQIGSISPDGIYRAPVEGGPLEVQVSATLRADPTKVAVARIRVRGS